MFLIEYDYCDFIDAETVNWVGIKRGKIEFTVRGKIGTLYRVKGEYQCSFVNCLQAINGNHVHNIEHRYTEINPVK